MFRYPQNYKLFVGQGGQFVCSLSNWKETISISYCERKKVLPMLLLQQYDVCFQKRNCILKEPTSTKSNGSIVAFVVLLFAWETFVLSLQLERPTILYRKASVFTKREERRGTCKLYKAMALFSKIKNFKFRPNSERLVHACKEIIGICDLMCISADWKSREMSSIY